MDHTTPEKKVEITNQLSKLFFEDFFTPVSDQHKKLQYKMLTKKSLCYSNKKPYRNYSIKDAELCQAKFGWPTYKLKVDIQKLTQNCKELLMFEDMKCSEVAKFDSTSSSIFSFGKKEETEEAKIANNVAEVDQCLDKMVNKYDECLRTDQAKLVDLYD
jgi:hypothetical protein